MQKLKFSSGKIGFLNHVDCRMDTGKSVCSKSAYKYCLSKTIQPGCVKHTAQNDALSLGRIMVSSKITSTNIGLFFHQDYGHILGGWHKSAHIPPQQNIHEWVGKI